MNINTAKDKKGVDYPKVLIFGAQPFNYLTGFGITLTNLFKEWPVNNLANLYYEDIEPDTTACNKYYKIDDTEKKWMYPICLFKKQAPQVKSIQNNFNKVKNFTIKRFVTSILFGSQIYAGNFRRYSISAKLTNWLEECRPHIIYCTVTNLADILFVQSLMKVTNGSLVVHILDDWINLQKNDYGILSKLCGKIIEIYLNKLFERASLLLGIGKQMCDEYSQRYNKSFIPFQNCPEPGLWIRNGRKSWEKSDGFSIVFTGAIYDNFNKETIKQIAMAMQRLNDSNKLMCRLIIYTNNKQIYSINQDMLNYCCVDIKQVVASDDEVAKIYGQADALCLPFDFDERSLSLSRHSMPTKLPTYMLSGTPIFVYGPITCAAVNYLESNQAGYVVSNRCTNNELMDKIISFYTDVNLRMKLGLRAQKLALETLSSDVVRKEFTRKMIQVISI